MNQRQIEEMHFDLSAYLRATKMLLRKEFTVWTFFSTSFLIDILSMIANIALFYYLATFVEVYATPYLEEIGGSYAAFMIVGIVLNSFLNVSLTSAYNAMCDGYFGGHLEFYMLSPAGIWVYIGSKALFSYMRATLNVVLYLFFGIVVFGVHLHINVLTGIVVILASTIAVTGLGLIGASLFSLIEAKGYTNPVQWMVGLLVGLVSGVYFPTAILPNWLRSVSFLLPQTYALRVARLAFLSNGPLSNTEVLYDLTVLTLFCIILVPTGIWLFKKGLERDQKEGTLSLWT